MRMTCKTGLLFIALLLCSVAAFVALDVDAEPDKIEQQYWNVNNASMESGTHFAIFQDNGSGNPQVLKSNTYKDVIAWDTDNRLVLRAACSAIINSTNKNLNSVDFTIKLDNGDAESITTILTQNQVDFGSPIATSSWTDQNGLSISANFYHLASAYSKSLVAYGGTYDENGTPYKIVKSIDKGTWKKPADSYLGVEIFIESESTVSFSKIELRLEMEGTTVQGDKTNGILEIPIDVAKKEESFQVNVNPCTGGTVSVSKTSAAAGESVVVTPVPEEGYVLDSLSFSPELEWIDGAITMPASDVTVSAVFKISREMGHTDTVKDGNVLVAVDVPEGLISSLGLDNPMFMTIGKYYSGDRDIVINSYSSISGASAHKEYVALSVLGLDEVWIHLVDGINGNTTGYYVHIDLTESNS